MSFTYTHGALTRVNEGSTEYASSISYHPNGMINTVRHGPSATPVNDIHVIDANSMQRPGRIYTTGASSNWSSGNYAWDGAGNVKAIGADYYIYDKVSRLVEGAPRAAAKKQRYAYDAFGNITRIETWNGSTWDPKKPTTAAATNRIQATCPTPITVGDMAASYDAAGNLTSWNRCDVGVVTSYAYYPTNLLRTLNGARTYGYTADGERIAAWDGAKLTLTLRGLDNTVLRVFELNGSTWSWTKDYVYRGGLPLASVTSSLTTHLTLDHLGSIRLMTRSDTRAMTGYSSFYGFGEVATQTGGTELLMFTGHERDQQGTPSAPTDDLDYMHARYYNPNIARFLSVDPGRDNNAKVPQSWNLYAYVRNNPVNATDPDGRIPVFGAVVGGTIDLTVQKLVLKRSWKEINWVSVGVSAASGATGVGLGRVVAKNFATVGARLAVNTAGSAAIGAASSVTNTVGSNLTQGRPAGEGLTMEGVAGAAALSGVLGGAGAALDEGVGAASRVVAGKFHMSDLLNPDIPFYAVGNRATTVESLGIGAGNAVGTVVSNSGAAVDLVPSKSSPGPIKPDEKDPLK